MLKIIAFLAGLLLVLLPPPAAPKHVVERARPMTQLQKCCSDNYLL